MFVEFSDQVQEPSSCPLDLDGAMFQLKIRDCPLKKNTSVVSANVPKQHLFTFKLQRPVAAVVILRGGSQVTL